MALSATLHAVQDAISAGCAVNFAKRGAFQLRLYVGGTYVHTKARTVRGHRYALTAAALLKDDVDAWLSGDEVVFEFGTEDEVYYTGVALAAVGATEVDGIL